MLHRYGKISTQTSKRGKVRIGNSDRKEEEGAAAAGEVDSDDDFEADMALELKERVQVRSVVKFLTRPLLPGCGAKCCPDKWPARGAGR